jgi:hypothetical protein
MKKKEKRRKCEDFNLWITRGNFLRRNAAYLVSEAASIRQLFLRRFDAFPILCI